MTRMLWLYSYDPRYNFDEFLHLKYTQYLATHPGVKLALYGPRLDEAYPLLVPTPYSIHKTLADIHQEFPFDMVIANTKSRLFAYYSPFTKRAEGCWLPSDFKTYPTRKIMLEEDYHYEPDDVWYQEAGFDLLINRHYFNAERKGVMKHHRWLPFSVDPGIFHPLHYIKRQRKLCLAASSTPGVYVHRKMVMDILKPLNFLDGYTTQHWIGNEYADVLRRYIAHVSCSSIYHITPAKMFEIMSSGSVLFTNLATNYGLRELFPRDSYVAYAPDGSDVVDHAKRLIEDEAYCVETATKGQKWVWAHHTHFIRTEEMLQLIKEEIG